MDPQVNQQKPVDGTILDRLRATVPDDQRRILRLRTTLDAEVSEKTYYRVLSGRSANLKVALALSRYLNCTVEQLFDPTFLFTNPKLADIDQLVEVGLVKEKRS